MATTANFVAPTLSILDDDASDSIIVSRTAPGALLINGGAVTITGGAPTVANTTLISVAAGAGDDTVTLNEANGALPGASINGEAGNDTLTGGSGADQLFGGIDNDTLLGKGGADTLFGGSGNDILTGGDADDLVLGEAGDDRFIWNPGDDTDLFEGGDGIDTAEVNGGNGAESFMIAANGARVRFDRITPAPFSLDLGTTEQIVLNPNGGADQLTIGDLSGTGLQHITVNLGSSGGPTGDGQVDSVTLNAGTGSNLVEISTASLTAMVTVTGAEVGDVVQIYGMSGEDTIIAGSFEHSVFIDGGTEIDTISYAGATAGATVNLSNSAGNEGAATGHSYTSIENAIGSSFDDLLVGTSESNTLDGGAGTDYLQGLAGDDTYRVDNAGDVIIETASGGANDLVLASVNYVLSGPARVETLATTRDNGKTDINLTGNNFAQSIIGNNGDNKLSGKDGDDFLFGRKGEDKLDGGDGKDSFVFNTKLGATNIDTIKHYVKADDTMLLENTVFTELTTLGKLTKSAFYASATGQAHDFNDRILYETDTGKLFYDRDGLGNAAAVQFAVLSGHPTIGHGEFVII